MKSDGTVLTPMGGVELQVKQYDASTWQTPHYDGCARVSFLLRGDVREATARGAIHLQSGDVLIKSSLIKHETWFGDNPVRIASICFAESEGRSLVSGSAWTPRRGPLARKLGWAMAQSIAVGNVRTAFAAAADLLANPADENGHESSRAPGWLSALRDELCEVGLKGVDVAAVASAIGVHPVHVSRRFRRCYGTSLTEFAQAWAVHRALVLLDESEMSLSEVAAHAGFYDQSHLGRVVRTVTGLTPGILRSVLDSSRRIARDGRGNRKRKPDQHCKDCPDEELEAN